MAQGERPLPGVAKPSLTSSVFPALAWSSYRILIVSLHHELKPESITVVQTGLSVWPTTPCCPRVHCRVVQEQQPIDDEAQPFLREPCIGIRQGDICQALALRDLFPGMTKSQLVIHEEARPCLRERSFRNESKSRRAQVYRKRPMATPRTHYQGTELHIVPRSTRRPSGSRVGVGAPCINLWMF